MIHWQRRPSCTHLIPSRRAARVESATWLCQPLLLPIYIAEALRWAHATRSSIIIILHGCCALGVLRGSEPSLVRAVQGHRLITKTFGYEPLPTTTFGRSEQLLAGVPKFERRVRKLDTIRPHAQCALPTRLEEVGSNMDLASVAQATTEPRVLV